MRNREVIEREMYRAREDLEQNIAELKHVVQEKMDVKARARVAVAKGKEKAHDAYEAGKTKAHDAFEVGKTKAHDAFVRGKAASRDLAERGKEGAADLYVKAKDHPEYVAAIAGGLIFVGAIAYIGRQKQWW